MNATELEEARKKIEKAKSDKAKAEGAMEQIESRWKTEFKCSNVEEAKALLKDLEQRKTKLSTKLETLSTELNEKLNAF